MTSPSEQAGLVAGTLRAKPSLLCAVLKELRDEKIVGDWEGRPEHQARFDPWQGIPVCAVWRDRNLPAGKQWRWAVRVKNGSSGICATREHSKAAATINLKGRGYTITDWTEDE